MSGAIIILGWDGYDLDRLDDEGEGSEMGETV